MTMKNYREQLIRYFANMMGAGFSYSEADAIRRDAERIDTWNTKECNGNIQWAEAGQVNHKGRALQADKPYSVHGQDNPNSPPCGYWTRIADRYTPARARIDATVKARGYTVRHQGDPRGLPVHIVISAQREICPPIRPYKGY